MNGLIKRLGLAGAAAIATTAPAAATARDGGGEAAQDRRYLPEGIIVTGNRQGYGENDGSTGTKTPTPATNVPQSITFVTEDQMEDQSIRQLGEALRYVPGLSLETGEGHRDEIFIRGQETTADFYLDGLRDDAQYYRPLYNIEQIEVLKGANALIFGRGGGGGVINRVSKTARINGASAEFDLSIDTFGAYAILGDINTTLSDKAALRLNATFDEFNSNRDFYDGRFIGFSPTSSMQLSNMTRLTVTYSYDDDRRLVDRGNPADGDGPLRGVRDTLFGDPGFNDTEAQIHIVRTRIDHEFSGDLSINATLQYAEYDKAYQNILPRRLTNNGADVEFSGYRDTQIRENFIAQANLVWQFETGTLGHTILAGAEGAWQESNNGRANVTFADESGGGTGRFTAPLGNSFAFPALGFSAAVRDRDSDLEVFSAYLQDQIDLGEHLQFIAGLRWDRFDLRTIEQITNSRGDRVDNEFSPRLGLIIKPSQQLSLYASYSESFLPQAGDQFFLLSPTNAEFEPEKFTNYEIGVKWAPKDKLFVTGALFQLDRTNTRATDPDNSGLTILTGESRTRGLEFNLVGDISSQWQANIGYSYLDGEITGASLFGAEGRRLQQLPRHQVTAWTRYDFSNQFGLGMGLVYQDEQFASFSNSVTLPDYLRVDAAAYYTLDDRISLQLNVENLFDAEYFPSAHGDNNIQPGRPFNARLGVRVAF